MLFLLKSRGEKKNSSNDNIYCAFFFPNCTSVSHCIVANASTRTIFLEMASLCIQAVL